MILTDVRILDNISILEENKSRGTMKIRGVFQRADEANNNKRVYPKKILEAQITRLEESLKNRQLLGELDHPAHDVVKLSNASHLITNLYMDGNEMIGEAELLNTPTGKIAQVLINDGVKIGISSRGFGTLGEEKDGVRTVNEDYQMLTFDLVADPSTKGAFPGVVNESNERREYIEKTLKKVLGEKAMLQMLEDKLAFKNNKIPELKVNLSEMHVELKDAKPMKKRVSRLIKSADKSPQHDKLAKRALYKQLAKDRMRGIIKGKPNPDRDDEDQNEQKVNPWAVCHSSTGKKKTNKFERCVQKVKKKYDIK